MTIPLTGSVLGDPALDHLRATLIPCPPHGLFAMIEQFNASLGRSREMRCPPPVAEHAPLLHPDGTPFLALVSRQLSAYERAWLERAIADLPDAYGFSVLIPLAVNLAKPVDSGYLRVRIVPHGSRFDGVPTQEDWDWAGEPIRLAHPGCDPKFTVPVWGANVGYLAPRELTQVDMARIGRFRSSPSSCADPHVRPVTGLSSVFVDIRDDQSLSPVS